jgi:uncharacterized protein (TIGR02266 family)
MADPKKSRKSPRAQISLVARYRSPTAFEFVKEECLDLSAGGMFIKSPAPAPAGTLIKLECDVDGGAQTIRGVARVVWLRETESEGQPTGMGVKFVKLEAGGREAIQAVLKRLGPEADAELSPSTHPPAAGTPQPFPRTPSAAPASADEAADAVEATPANGVGSTERPTSARPDARELRERLNHAKRSHGASDAPPPMDAATVADSEVKAPTGAGPTPLPRVQREMADDSSERPTVPEMARPPEVASAIAQVVGHDAAAQGEALIRARPTAPRPATDEPKATVKDAEPKPSAPQAASPGPEIDAAPFPSRKQLIYAMVAVLGGVALYVATQAPEPETTETPQSPEPAQAAAPEPQPPAPAAQAPAAQPAPTAPSAAPQAPAPKYVLEIATDPDGALVRAGDKTLTAPGKLELDAIDEPLELTAQKDGFADATAMIDRVGFMLEDGALRRRMVLTLLPKQKPVPAEIAPTAPMSGAVEKPKPATPATAKALTKKAEARKPAEPSPAPSAAAPAAKPIANEPVKPEAVAVAATPEPTVAAPKAAPSPEPKPATEVAQTPLQAASACLATGDNACVIKALEGKAKSAQELELLIETYRAMGKAEQADQQMQVYVERFPAQRRAGSYRRVLEHRQTETPAAAP